jgi:spermidine synthase
MTNHKYNNIPELMLIAALLVFSALPSPGGETDSNSIPPYSPPQKGFWKTLNDLLLPHYESRNTIFSKETAHHNISVEDDESGKRHLVFQPNHGSQGVIKPDDPKKLIPNFMKYSFLALPALGHPPQNVLFIGLGAGIMPMFLARAYPSTKMEIVEIDKELKPIAEKYFGFKMSDNMILDFEDGRFFINHCRKKYDLIVLDAYSAVDIPFQFTTVEFFTNAAKCLTHNGILIANLANFGRRNFLASEFKTVKSVFKHVAVVPCPRNTNYVLFASKAQNFNGNEWRKACEKLDEKRKWGFKLAPFLAARLSNADIDGFAADPKILTDAFAPVNSLD